MALKLILIQSPLVKYGHIDIAPPIGLLILGRIALEEGFKVEIIDFNLECAKGEICTDFQFYEMAAKRIVELNPDIVGFTSMGLDSQIGLELTREIKLKESRVCCILGGVHYSSIALEATNLFQWIDHIFVGGGEGAFRSFLKCYKSKNKNSGKILRNLGRVNNTYVAADYSLISCSSYFKVNPLHLALIEQGRGCVFDCSFCYSKNHWRNVFEKDTKQLLYELYNLTKLGFKKVFFVQDNFLNYPKKTLFLTHEVSQAKLGLKWQAYATIAQLTENIIDSLKDAGCIELFIGVDAVTNNTKKIFKKSLYKNVADLSKKITYCSTIGIQTTTAFLIRTPLFENLIEIEEILIVALNARLCGANIRLNILTNYPGTSLKESKKDLRYSEFKTKLLLDSPEILWQNHFAQQYPGLFPFHSTTLAPDQEELTYEFIHAAFTLINLFPKTLEKILQFGTVALNEIILKICNRSPPLLSIHPRERRKVTIDLFVKAFASYLEQESSQIYN